MTEPKTTKLNVAQLLLKVASAVQAREEREQREREQLIQELTANLRSPSGRQGA